MSNVNHIPVPDAQVQAYFDSIRRARTVELDEAERVVVLGLYAMALPHGIHFRAAQVFPAGAPKYLAHRTTLRRLRNKGVVGGAGDWFVLNDATYVVWDRVRTPGQWSA